MTTITEKQVYKLGTLGVSEQEAKKMSKEEASTKIDELVKNQQGVPSQPSQQPVMDMEMSLASLLKASERVEAFIKNSPSTTIQDTARYQTLMQLYAKLQMTKVISSSRKKY